MANDIAEKPAAAEEGVWTQGPDGELVPDYDSAFPEINEGEVVHGTVVRVDKDEVLVDIGYKSEGVIPVAELTIEVTTPTLDEPFAGQAAGMCGPNADRDGFMRGRRGERQCAGKYREQRSDVRGEACDMARDMAIRGAASTLKDRELHSVFPLRASASLAIAASRYPAKPSSFPPWYTAKLQTQARAVM